MQKIKRNIFINLDWVITAIETIGLGIILNFNNTIIDQLRFTSYFHKLLFTAVVIIIGVISLVSFVFDIKKTVIKRFSMISQCLVWTIFAFLVIANDIQIQLGLSILGFLSLMLVIRIWQQMYNYTGDEDR